jgi:hypothetical protein
MNRSRLWIAFAVVVLAGAGASWAIRHFRSERSSRDIHIAEQLDTAHVKRADSSARVDSAVHTLRRIGGTAMKEADRIHAVADTAGQHAITVRDSLEMWRKRDSLHVVEIDSLRRAHHVDSLQVLFLTRDRDAWKTHSDSVVTAMDALKRDLKTAEQQCRILPFVPCPTRTEAAIGGAIAGALVAHNNHKVFVKLFTLGRG